MTLTSRARRAGAVAAALVLTTTAVLGAVSPAAAASDPAARGNRLFVNPQSTTLLAAATLSGLARADAQLLGSFASANWFTSGTPAEVTAAVSQVTRAATADGSVPVLVAYNLPFRDCAQYSAGGAADTAAYNAWIDAFAAGIGDSKAIVVVEPDGLGIIPWYTTLSGEREWCQPAELDPATAASERLVQVNHAVDALAALPNVASYLDGTHSGWLGVGEISDRLIKAGVERADGFFLNASNYVQTERLQKYGSWVSDCIHLSQNSWWEPSYCGSQYYPANPDDFTTWGATDAAYAQAFADTGLVRDAASQAHFVIDTSRNGQGPWVAPAGKYSDAEVWCNPPGRGAGMRPTTDTGQELIDAYLWIKVPGESDGQCYRGTGGPTDPERGMVDPAAGQWFPEQARELIQLANPALAAPTCAVSYTVHGDWKKGFIAQLWLENTGTAPIRGWQVGWNFAGTERIDNLWGGSVSQNGTAVSVTSEKWNATIKPGAKTTLGFTAVKSPGVTSEPLLFTLNGAPCVSD